MTRSRARFVALLLAGGAALGLAARSLDLLPGMPGELAGLVSSVGAWGFVAVLTGFLAGSPLRGAIGGGVVLLVASLLYYAISFASGAWQTQFYDATTNTPFPDQGLTVLVRSCLLWCAASVVGGPALGVSGALIRGGRARVAAVAAGVAGGMLATPALTLLCSIRFQDSTASLLELAVVVVGTAILFARRDGRRLWPAFAVALAVTAIVATIATTALTSSQAMGF